MAFQYTSLKSYLSISHGLSVPSEDGFNKKFKVPKNVIIFMNGTTEPIQANQYIMTCMWYLALTTTDVKVTNTESLRKGLSKVFDRFNRYLHNNPIIQADLTQFKPKFCIVGSGYDCPNLYLDYNVEKHVYGLYPLPVSLKNGPHDIVAQDLSDYLNELTTTNEKMFPFYKARAVYEKCKQGADFYRNRYKEQGTLSQADQQKFDAFFQKEQTTLALVDKLYQTEVAPRKEFIEKCPVIQKVEPFVILQDENASNNISITIPQERVVITNSRVRCDSSSCTVLDRQNYVKDIVEKISQSDVNAIHIVAFFACRSGLQIKDEDKNMMCIGDTDTTLKGVVDKFVSSYMSHYGGKRMTTMKTKKAIKKSVRK
jgi:hypothetical protein